MAENTTFYAKVFYVSKLLKVAKYIYSWAKNILFTVGFMFIAILTSYSFAYSRIGIPTEVKLDLRPLVADNSLRYFWIALFIILAIGGIIELFFGLKKMLAKKPKVEGTIIPLMKISLPKY